MLLQLSFLLSPSCGQPMKFFFQSEVRQQLPKRGGRGVAEAGQSQTVSVNIALFIATFRPSYLAVPYILLFKISTLLTKSLFLYTL